MSITTQGLIFATREKILPHNLEIKKVIILENLAKNAMNFIFLQNKYVIYARQILMNNIILK